MKTKLTKMIMSCLAFSCGLVCLAAAMALGPSTSATAGPAPARVCSVGMLNGLYLWTFDGYQNFGGNPVPKAVMQGTRFNGNGTFTDLFGTANIGGTIVIDTTGTVGTIRSQRTARARSQSPTAQALTCTSDRVHSSFGSPRLGEVLAARD